MHVRAAVWLQDGTVAELLTDNKLSELACLTLYMMYEKKQLRNSFWCAAVVGCG